MPVVEYEVKDKICYITLNRPEKLNAVNTEVFEQLIESCDKFAYDPNAWVAIVSGKGRAFCTGYDLLQPGGAKGRPHSADEVYMAILNVKKPMIAAVHGYCLAQGDGIALSCDIVIAAEKTQFGWPQAKRGISSTSGPSLGFVHMPRKKAAELLFTASFVGPEEALKLNLINKVVPEGQHMTAAEEMAKVILKNSPMAVWGMKEAMILGRDLDLLSKMKIAFMIGDRINTTEDHAEGIKAFAEKRDPVFPGR